MLLADTSAWIACLQGAGTPPAARLRAAIAEREVVIVDPILMELLSGARRDHVQQTRLLLESQHVEPLAPRLDWLDAATIDRELRRRGATIRSQIDALISAAAIRLELPVLHGDRDYDVIAEHTDLRIVPT